MLTSNFKRLRYQHTTQAVPEPGSNAQSTTTKIIPPVHNTLSEHSPTQASPREQKQIINPLQQALKGKWSSPPRLSKWGNPCIDLNQQVSVATKVTSSTKNQEAVECCHLALAFAIFPGKKRELVQSFAAPEGIFEHFNGQWEQFDHEYERIISCSKPNNKHIVCSDEFGHYLAALANTLLHDCEKSSQANCLLGTNQHAMALHLQRKHQNGLDYFTAKVYDPNTTAGYLRVVRHKPQDFSQLTLEDLLVDRLAVFYYGKVKDAPLSVACVCLNPNLAPKLNRRRLQCTPENMFLALHEGSTYDVQALLESLQSLQPVQQMQVLRAQNPDHEPGLIMAFYFGHQETIQTYISYVLDSKHLSTTQKKELLTAKQDRGISAFAIALAKGYTALASYFIDAVLSSTLQQSEKFELLQALDSGGTPGLYFAFRKGHSSTVCAFTLKVLSAHSFSQAQQWTLIAAKRPDGKSGLDTAKAHDHHDMLNTFRRLLVFHKISKPKI